VERKEGKGERERGKKMTKGEKAKEKGGWGEGGNRGRR
jgi:hypothetical protein